MAGQMGLDLTGAQKCAVLCMALGPTDGAKILGQLSSEEVEEVSREIASMQVVDEDVVKSVLHELQSATQGATRSVRGGVDAARELLERALDPDAASEAAEKIQKQAAQGRLAHLERMEPEMFAHILRDEHPQTSAVILAHLNQQQASKALQSLPVDLGADILYRMARIEKISPEMLALLDAGLRSKTDLSLFREMSAPGGPAIVARVLNMTGGDLNQQLLKLISERNSELASRIESLMFVFEDLLLIDGRGIQKVLRDIDSQDLTLAMKAASDELQKHLKSNMSARAASALEEELELLGPARVSDVEEAQKRILESVRELEDAGEIVVRREGGSDEFIT